ncbi:MAG: apolipoprotein N-acyltransferase [Flavobacteriales bacterium]|nr:apolipoprotein N-acyltransferase [Flavobacteriales bacterium]
MSQRFKYLLIPLLGGAMLGLAWPPNSLPFLLFLGFVPFFILEDFFTTPKSGKYFFGYLYLGLFLFNFITTWWVWYASPGGAVFMLIANTALMTLPFLAYRILKRNVGLGRALFGFILAWLSFEYFHFRWQLSYPWLTLGNAFATTPNLVQWYEYTGVLGGSLWILAVNSFLFYIGKNYRKRHVWITVALLVFPIFLSIVIWFVEILPHKGNQGKKVLIIQPNIDPYNEKFADGGVEGQLEKFFMLCDQQRDEHINLIVLPETALANLIDEEELENYFAIRRIKSYLKNYPNPDVKMLIGASTMKYLPKTEQPSQFTRINPYNGQYYTSYNTALLIDKNGVQKIYHKSKLVPGVEAFPFPKFFAFFDKLLHLDLGGEAGNLGRDSSAVCFNVEDVSVAPLICYESIYGEYVSDFTNQQADMLAVITNDGWWKNTAGHKQHKHYARLRAIEQRRWVVRSANTGISCVIDDAGNVHQELGWWQEGIITEYIPERTKTTFYSKSGDYIGKIAQYLFVLLMLSVFVKWKVRQGK